MLKKAKKHWKNEFFQGGLLLTASSFLVNFLNYLFNFLVAHSLGPIGYGEIIALFSYISIAAVPVGVLSTLVIQKISASGNNRFSYAASLEEYFLRRLKKWWLPLMAIFLLTPLVPRLTNLSVVSGYLLLPLIATSFLVSFYGAALQGLRLFWWFSLLALFAALMKLSGAILVILGLDGLSTIVITILVSSYVAFWAKRLVFQRMIKNKVKQPFLKLEKRLIHLLTSRQFLITLLSILALISFNNADIIFVKKFFPSTVSGIYSAWSLLAKIVLYLISPLTAVGFIFFASSDTQFQHRPTMNRSLILLFVFGIFIVIIYHFFAPILTSWLFGQRFTPVIPYFDKAAIFGIGYTYLYFLNYYFLAKKSSFSLILPILLPLYLLTLFFLGKSLNIIMNINIVFIGVLAFLYLSAYGYNIIVKNDR